MDDELYFTTTKRGKPKLILEGFGYVQDKRGSNGMVYWRCEKRDTLNCRGRVKTSDGGDVVFAPSAHCHAPDPAKEEIAIARDEIRRRAATTQESSHLIVTNETNRLSASAAASLPSRKALKRAVQRERVKQKCSP